ncbi:glycosyltransferase [Lachnospiraceae bacterium 54-11]
MISIVLPTYNGEKYIEETINSILEQTYKDIELIVVNDCSTDGTLNIINKIADSNDRIAIINNKKNQKLPRSLNIGFANANGEYYTWISDDNIYKNDALEKMYYYLLEHKDVDIVCTEYELINEKGERIGPCSKMGTWNKMYERNQVGACFLYKKQVHWELNGYDETQFLVEDYDFWLRAFRRFRFAFIPEVLYSYREHSGSLTSLRSSEIEYKVTQLIIREIEREECTETLKVYGYKRLITYYYDIEEKKMMIENLQNIKKLSYNEYRNMDNKYKLAIIFGIGSVKALLKIVRRII